MEQACSNIAEQRTIDDHTNYMVRARPKCKIGWEATEYWSASNLMWWFRLLHPTRTWGITRDRYGCHHLPPTPQPESRKCIHMSLHTQAPCLHIQKLPKSPRVPDPMDRQVKNLGIPNGTMNHHLNFALISIIKLYELLSIKSCMLLSWHTNYRLVHISRL